jgi:hypothetical protein
MGPGDCMSQLVPTSRLSPQAPTLLAVQVTNLALSIGKPGVVIKDEIKYLEENKDRYLALLLEKFIPNNNLTHNGILVFTQYLFDWFPEATTFNQNYFPIMFV